MTSINKKAISEKVCCHPFFQGTTMVMTHQGTGHFIDSLKEVLVQKGSVDLSHVGSLVVCEKRNGSYTHPVTGKKETIPKGFTVKLKRSVRPSKLTHAKIISSKITHKFPSLSLLQSTCYLEVFENMLIEMQSVQNKNVTFEIRGFGTFYLSGGALDQEAKLKFKISKQFYSMINSST